MLRRVFCLLSLLCLYTFSARSQQAVEASRQPRILLLLDGSSSMLQPWSGGDIRFKAAARVVEGLMDSIYAVNPGVEFGLRVYGHQSPAQNNDCYDSRMEVMFSKNNITQMGLRLASLRPFGVSPIAYSLRQAAENDLLDDVRNAYSIILITDGGESCGGNICDVVQNLINRKIFFRPYIISLVEYAPLKEQYACLGSYLQVGKPSDMGPAINQIVDAYRPILSMPIMAAKPPLAAPTTPPKPVSVTVPTIAAPEPRIAETTAVLQARNPRFLKLPVRGQPAPPRRLALPRLPAVVITPEPVVARQPEAPGAVLRGTALHRMEVPVWSYFRIAPRRMTLPRLQRYVYVPEPPQFAELPASLAAASPRSLRVVRAPSTPRLIWLPIPDPGRVAVTPEAAPVTQPRRDTPTVPKPVVDTPKRPKISMTVIKTDTAKRATPATPKPPAPPKRAEPEINVTREDAKETQLSIYFTDGRGKFYSSTPQLRLMDAATGKQVKQFYRTVDPNGNPDPQVVPAGTYNLVVATRANMVLKKIVVEESKNNKIIVKVANGSLRFRYDNNPNRPVTEFNAIVNIRFEDGPINQKQKCSEELEYAPGNYHIEINTLPVYQLNTDIDFGAITQIDIPEPGYVQFTNTTAIGPVQLFSPLGNQFMRFYGLRVTGNPDVQRVRLLPGVYEVHWVSNANTPRQRQEVLRFNIRSNMQTSIELN